MANKPFMSGNIENQSAAETARLKRSGTTEDQSAAETARLARTGWAGQSDAETNRLNRYAHKSDNIIVSASDEYKLDFLDNILDNFDTYTYHWKLFITPLKNAYDGTVLDSSVQTIIAESGVSDLTIDKVELHGIAVPSIEAGTGTQTTIKFEIVEPAGAGLLDKMFYQAVSLGIGNWMVMPCFLQLEFRGRDPDTAETVIDGSPSALSGLKWIWPIKLTNSKVNVTHVGSRYEFDAIVYDELAQSNSYFAIQQNVVLTDLTTFGKAMTDLEDKLNADQYAKLIDNYSIPDTYTIIIDDELAGIPLILPESNKSTSSGHSFFDLNKKTASYNPGTGIDKIVDSLLGSTAEFQKSLQNSDTPSSKPKSANAETDQMKNLWRVITETKPIAFDSLRQNNAVEITIFVVKYDLGTVDANASQTGGNIDTLPAAKKRMAEYIKKKILRKKYNYIFTGLNDQIIALDLNMNFSFAAAMSRFSGVFSDSGTQEKGISMQKNAEDEIKATTEIRKTLQLINNAKTDQDKDNLIAQAKRYLWTAQISDVNKARYTEILKYSKSVDRKAHTTAIIAAGGQTANGSLITDDKLNAAILSAQGLAQPTSNGLAFISDVNTKMPQAKEAYEIARASRAGKLRPIPFAEGPYEHNLAIGISPTSDAGRTRVSSIFATALYSSLDASLQTVKLTIKGDPYWLFPHPVPSGTPALLYKSKMANKSTAIDFIKKSQDNSVNFYGSDNFIVLRFRTPRLYNETSDVVDPFTEVETFSGVYKVITVISKFAAGKFTQELSCQLDPMINLSDFLNDIEVSSGKPPTPIVVIQPNAEFTNKTVSPRISGNANIPDGQVGTNRDANGNVIDVTNRITGKSVNNNLSNVPPSDTRA